MVNLIFYSSTRGEKRGGEKNEKESFVRRARDDRRRDVSLRKKRRGCDETTRGKTEEKRAGWLTPRVISKQRRGWIAAAAELIKFRSFAYYFSSPRRRRDANVCRNTPPPPWPRATSAIRVQTCSFFPYFPIPPPVSAKISRIAQPSFVFGQRIFFPLIYRSPYSQF